MISADKSFKEVFSSVVQQNYVKQGSKNIVCSSTGSVDATRAHLALTNMTPTKLQYVQGKLVEKFIYISQVVVSDWSMEGRKSSESDEFDIRVRLEGKDISSVKDKTCE